MKAEIIYRRSGTLYKIDGKEVTEAEYRAATPDRFEEIVEAGETAQSQTTTLWPLLSDSLGVSPQHIPEAVARNKRNGVNVDYCPKTGRAILNSPGERAKLIKLENFVDKT